MLSTDQKSGGFCFTAAIVLIFIANQAVLTGCRSTAPAGRCGLPDLCAPTVMEDPFPADQNVPPKGVDFAHFGYTRPQWRVLTSRESVCCVATEPSGPALIEQLPAAMQSTEGVMPSVPRTIPYGDWDF